MSTATDHGALAEFRDALADLKADHGRLEGKIDGIRGEIKGLNDGIKGEIKGLNTGFSAVKWCLIGVMVPIVVAILASSFS